MGKVQRADGEKAEHAMCSVEVLPSWVASCLAMMGVSGSTAERHAQLSASGAVMATYDICAGEMKAEGKSKRGNEQLVSLVLVLIGHRQK